MGDEVLIHYSDLPLVEAVDASERASQGRDPYFKPIGLWVSVVGPQDWRSWCESESFGNIEGKRQTRIVLAKDANILRLQDEDDIDRFTERFRLRLPRYRGDKSIDWPRVAESFDGIIIAPYQWSRRLSEHTSWYYGWDCASGCIWRSRAINQLIPLSSPKSVEVAA